MNCALLISVTPSGFIHTRLTYRGFAALHRLPVIFLPFGDEAVTNVDK
jgi:hypothetical protein